MKVLLTGANGQLAQDIRANWTRHEIVALPRTALDITSTSQIDEVIAQVSPDCIVNTAAFHLVDACEDQIDEAFRTNVVGVGCLARAAERQRAILVQFSTDYVFDGAKRCPYLEIDGASPISTYGQSRLAGEWMARHYCERSYVVRTCGLYGLGGASTHAGNFVETMLRLTGAGKALRVVDDQIVTPTSTLDLARKLEELVTAAAPFGTYHMTNTGQCSWYEFAREIFRLFGVSANLSPVSSVEYNARARRPAYSVLDNERLRQAGIAEFSPWQDALAEYAMARRARQATRV
jgi:dTDP-4-dehydrorhamnose reductase